ncbi:adenosine receptor A1-like [Solea senegalensis]|uniref:Adenosine receptor A1-like n=1 Tax=Solea senegalensis TaxID=28829 RepID=A0AAV6PQW9_SOLSE|nr:adenosine receptor A1-like [Solea senegalensis]
MWLYSLSQCLLAVAVIVVSVRLCLAVSGTGAVADNREGTQTGGSQPGSVSCCLRLCLGWVGAVGGALKVPVTVLVNLRTPQCLYTCITLVCFPLLVRQFTMFLLILITLDTRLQDHLAHRYSSMVTRRRALCVVLLCWVASVLSSFAQFFSSDVLNTRKNGGSGPSTTGLELHGNWTTSLPLLTPSTLPSWHHHDRKVIGKHLPYGGFLSKFYVEDMQNFTYAEIHRSHWVVCSPDTVLTPTFLVYVHGMMAFMLPLLCLSALYLSMLCIKHRNISIDPSKRDSCQVRTLALSLSLLVLLCLPIHVVHALLLFTPSIDPPACVHAVAMFLFQLYSLVPQILFKPHWTKVGEERTTFPLSVPNLPPVVAGISRGKSVSLALCEAVQAAPWLSAKHSLKAKVFPDV